MKSAAARVVFNHGHEALGVLTPINGYLMPINTRSVLLFEINEPLRTESAASLNQFSWRGELRESVELSNSKALGTRIARPSMVSVTSAFSCLRNPIPSASAREELDEAGVLSQTQRDQIDHRFKNFSPQLASAARKCVRGLPFPSFCKSVVGKTIAHAG